MYQMSDHVKRQYNSIRRQEQARDTRLRIIRAAHDLFVAKGYGRTTIAEMALAAGVAVETVYATFRNKPEVLRQAWYVNFRGDEEDVRLLYRPEIRAVLAEPDLATRFSKHAAVYTAVFRRIGPLLAALHAAGSEPAAAAMLAEWDAGRLDACTTYAKAAHATGQLAVSKDECRDVLAATMDGALWQRLVAERGWPDARFAAWLGRLWTLELVKPTGTPSQ
jgi:AcrR family transcriptional regulator